MTIYDYYDTAHFRVGFFYVRVLGLKQILTLYREVRLGEEDMAVLFWNDWEINWGCWEMKRDSLRMLLGIA